jgi:hypothetical protein
MDILSDIQASSLRGGFFSLTIAPTIVVSNAITTALQTSGGASVGVGLLGASVSSELQQLSGLALFNTTG